MIFKGINEIDQSVLKDFDCGNLDLNQFLKKFASRNDNSGYGKTVVLLEKNEIIGYFTLASCSIKYDEFPFDGNLSFAKYPIPCIKIAMLAVNKKRQNKGYGKILIKEAFMRILSVTNTIGIRLIIVDAKESSIKFHERLGFLKLKTNSNAYFLCIETLKDAFRNK